MEINSGLKSKVSLKSTPASTKYHFATNRVLYLIISSNALFLVWKTHLHPTLLRSFGSFVNSHAMLAMNESHLWISMFYTIIQQCHISPIFAVLG